jgi:hypothetical protein
MLTSDDRDVRSYVAALGEEPLIGLAQSSDPGEIACRRDVSCVGRERLRDGGFVIVVPGRA